MTSAADRFTGGRGAIESDGGTYRYRLWRTRPADAEHEQGSLLAPPRPANPRERRVTFVMLNPSTAGPEHEDPTLRRCCHFAERHGAGPGRPSGMAASGRRERGRVLV